MSDDDTQNPRRKIDLSLDPAVAKGTYANATVVSHGRHEVVLDFVAALPHHRPQVVARMVLPKVQAQALARTLTRTLERAEAQGPTVPGAATEHEDEGPN
ncbi:MAG: DUF3467 domain-containing protein [Trueperaceae bacterium]